MSIKTYTARDSQPDAGMGGKHTTEDTKFRAGCSTSPYYGVWRRTRRGRAS